MASKKKKGGALAAAASRRLARIGAPQMSPEDFAHAMFHAEERGEVQRVPLDDGSWAWQMQTPDGPQQVKPTPEMLAALARFETGHHEH